jgi:hypothetical protein
MMLSIKEAINIYNVSNATIHKHIIENTVLMDYCFSINKIERELDSLKDDEYWVKTIKLLKLFRYEYCSLPLPFNHQELINGIKYSDLSNLVNFCKYTYSQYYSSLLMSFNLLGKLRKEIDNPLIDKIIAINRTENCKNSAILMKDSIHIPIFEKYIKSNDEFINVEVVSIYNLKGTSIYDSIYLIGPSYWYPEYIFTSPRAKFIHLIRYRWINDGKRQFVNLITGKPDINDKLRQMEAAHVVEPPQKLQTDYLDPKEILPLVNWEQFAKADQVAIQSEGVLDQICAKLYLLDGGMATYLESTDNAKVLVIDLEADEDESGKGLRVRRVLVRDITRGMFLLLRTAGGGDLIAPLADRILGSEAQIIRQSQFKWKSALRSYILKNNLFTTCIDLTDHGAFHANESNLRNWASESNNIRPADDRDFEAITIITGLDSEFLKIKQNADKLSNTHQRAGVLIRKLLLRKVMQTDLKLLEKTGRIEFKISEEEGASITAFRVVDISPGTYTVPVFKHAHPFKFESYAWQ